MSGDAFFLCGKCVEVVILLCRSPVLHVCMAAEIRETEKHFRAIKIELVNKSGNCCPLYAVKEAST